MDKNLTELIERHGFAIIPEVLGAEEVSLLVEALSHAELRRGKAGARHTLSYPAINAVANGPLLHIAQQVLGPQTFPFRATLFDKSVDANWGILWHQDTALPLRERRNTPGWGPWSIKEGIPYAHAPASALSQVLALRLHLDDSTSQNGPLRVLPGTHAHGLLSDEAITQFGKEDSSIDCIVSAGGVIAMRPLLVHGSSKSQSEKRRRVLHIEYAASTVVENGLRLAVA